MSQYTNPVKPYLFTMPAVNLDFRGMVNPTRMKLPPAMFGLDATDGNAVQFVDGKAFIGSVPLGDITAQTGPANPQAIAPVNIKDASKYGDSVIIALVFTGAGFATIAGVDSPIVLSRPNNFRSMLMIQNQTVGGLIYYDYDKIATTQSMALGIGGSRNYAGEVVPQGNLSILSTGAGTVVLEYMNINL